jgi:hypothetical protein
MVVADTAIFLTLLIINSFFFCCSKVFARFAVSDPSNKDNRLSLTLDFVETSRVLEIMCSKSMRRKSRMRCALSYLKILSLIELQHLRKD